MKENERRQKMKKIRENVEEQKIKEISTKHSYPVRIKDSTAGITLIAL